MRTYLSDRRLPGGVTLAASVLLLLSPAVLGFAGPGAASAYVLAAIGAIIGAKTFARPVAWDGRIIAAAGLFFVAMPWIVGFVASVPAVWSHVVLGLVMIAVGLWALWNGRRTAETTDAGATPTFHRHDDSTVGT